MDLQSNNRKGETEVGKYITSVIVDGRQHGIIASRQTWRLKNLCKLLPCPCHALFGQLVIRYGSALSVLKVGFGPWESAKTPGAGFGLVALLWPAREVQPPGQATFFSTGICIAHGPVLRVPKVGFVPWESAEAPGTDIGLVMLLQLQLLSQPAAPLR